MTPAKKDEGTLSRYARWALIIPVLSVVVILAMVYQIRPRPVILRDFSQEDITRLLATLFLVTLLFERALEVFISAWREPDTGTLEVLVEELRAKTQTTPPPAPEALQNLTASLEKAEKKLAVYKDTTKRIALGSTVVLGIVISAAGIRTLQPLIDPASWSQLSPTQASLFQTIDVGLTGGLIAGGSDGLHKVTQLITDFLEVTRRRNNQP